MSHTKATSPPPFHYCSLSLSLPPSSSSAAVAKTAECKLVCEQTSRLREVDLLVCCYGQHTVFNRESAQKPSMQTVTHVIKYDLFFSQSKRIICTEASAYSVYNCIQSFTSLPIIFYFQVKNSENILLAALQSWNQCGSQLKQSAPSPPPDWQYIVIHCTPAAGSLSLSLSWLQPFMAI